MHRYETFDDVLGYCRYSANPVGHLVLYVCGYRDAERQQLSDYTCTALQLANFWQDVSVDWGKGRVYLPLEDMRRFGVSEREIAERRPTPEFLRLMSFEVERAREWFERGLPLAGTRGPRTGDRHRTVQPRRTGDPERHRAAGLRRLAPAAGNLQARKLWLVVSAGMNRLIG